MKYKKKENEKLDKAYKESKKHGFNIKLSEETIFFRKGFHWEYINRKDIDRIHRRVEEVISHTSCCAENMDIQKFIVTLKSGETVSIHVCDGEPRLAERLFDELKTMWSEVSFGTK